MKKWISALVVLGFSAVALQAQSLETAVDFTYFFDNLEYGDGSRNTGFDPAGTVNAIRLTPGFALRVDQGASVQHRLNVGLDVMKDMGSGIGSHGLAREMTIWYSAQAAFSNGGTFSAAAGCFPRSFSEGYYGKPFLDEAVIFYDPNLEGMFFKYRNTGIYAELGLDWMGQYGGGGDEFRRERFQILSSGRWNFYGDLDLRWAAVFDHFANSPAVRGVVDNDLVNPMIHWNPGATVFDELDLGVGALVSYQFDRLADDPRVNAGFFARQTLGKWNVGIDNSLYIGGDLQPFRGKFGDELYRGEECYATGTGVSWCDQMTLFYAPGIASFVDLVVAFQFHLGQPVDGHPLYRGWQQMLSLRFHLDKK